METKKSYVLIEASRLEELLRNNYLLSKSVLAFEYLCSHSDRPMYLTAQGVFEILEIPEEELDDWCLKRRIKVKVVQNQRLYSFYDLVLLSEQLRRRKLQRQLAHVPRFVAARE